MVPGVYCGLSVATADNDGVVDYARAARAEMPDLDADQGAGSAHPRREMRRGDVGLTGSAERAGLEVAEVFVDHSLDDHLPAAQHQAMKAI